MSDILSPKQTAAIAYFCPKCQTPTEYSLVSSNDFEVACGGCGWSGKFSQLAATPFKHGFSSDDQITETMTTDLRNLLAKTAAANYGAFLLKWGFMDQPISALQLASYLSAISKASVKAIVETRKQLTEDKARERAGLSGTSGSKD